MRSGYTLGEAFHLKNRLPSTGYRNPHGRYTHHFDYRNTPARLKLFWKSTEIRWTGRRHEKRPLIKDPIAIFSALWLYENFQTENVILIRHPAAFVSSLKRVGWHFNFENFLKQKPLMTDYLHPFEKDMLTASGDMIERSSILWNCIHHVIHEYQLKFPDWIYLRHMDISLNPMIEFEKLFTRLNLPFTEKIKNYISLTTGSKNPAEVSAPGKLHQLKRDSAANVKNWKKRLTKAEINLIRDITAPVAGYFYSDRDWD